MTETLHLRNFTPCVASPESHPNRGVNTGESTAKNLNASTKSCTVYFWHILHNYVPCTSGKVSPGGTMSTVSHGVIR